MISLLSKIKELLTSQQSRSEDNVESDYSLAEIKAGKLPEHVAIIMDGNGRWAQNRGLPRSAGHKAGLETLKSIMNLALKLDIKCITVYAFSTENWKRPPEEVKYLMGLFEQAFKQELTNFQKKGAQINIIGYKDRLPDYVKEMVDKTMEKTADNQNIKVNIALDYGSRGEIIEAVKKIASQVQKGMIQPEDIDSDLMGQSLYTASDPEIDLLIRPGGEKRISNFLLWQLAYAELYFSDIYWPDFKEKEFLAAISEFQKRERRFGGLKKAGEEDA